MTETREIPHTGDRVETGPVRFGDDWKGVFLRGDYAIPMGMALDAVISDLEKEGYLSGPYVPMLKELANTLASANEHREEALR